MMIMMVRMKMMTIMMVKVVKKISDPLKIGAIDSIYFLWTVQ